MRHKKTLAYLLTLMAIILIAIFGKDDLAVYTALVVNNIMYLSFNTWVTFIKSKYFVKELHEK